MNYSTLTNIDLTDKRVLVRCDLNVPMKEGTITNENRILASLPTITHVLKHAKQVILMSHLGRPAKAKKKGVSEQEIKKQFTLKPVAQALETHLGEQVLFVEDYFGKDLPADKIILLENIQFNEGETTNDDAFASKLASLADVYVNDGFGQSHREYASLCAITKHLPSCAGLLVEKEITQLSRVLEPQQPFVAIVAGAKADKIGALRFLLEKAECVLTGGALANTFLKAKGVDIGASKFDQETLDVAQELLAQDKLILPVDGIVTQEFSADSMRKTVPVNSIEPGWMMLDVGPQTVDLYKEKLAKAKTVLWGGPLGVFELKPFAQSSKAVADYLVSLNTTVIVGGGDSAAAVQSFGVADKMTHVSTGGGASLEFIEKQGHLPAIDALTISK